MRPSMAALGCLLIGLGCAGVASAMADEDQLAFAVVSEAPKDKAKVPAKVAIDGTVSARMII